MTPPERRIADLHCHYPMHVLADGSPKAVRDRLRCRLPWFWLDLLRAFVFTTAAHLINTSSWRAGWRVSYKRLEQAQARLVLSVLYDPAFELLVIPGCQRPRKGAFKAIMCQLRCVEWELARADRGNTHRVVKTATELDDALQNGRMAVVHCLEGGLYLGTTEAAVAENVKTLAQRGVAYITLAHLWYRGIATNVSALPGWSDERYNAWFHQHGKGLSWLGEAAIRAMYEHRVLVDIAHMDADSLRDTWALLEDLDDSYRADPKERPVIASHNGVRFGDQAYMLDKDTIERIAARDGVVGLILAHHQLDDRVSCVEKEPFKAVRCHVDRMFELTGGSHAHTAIGSDLDGFIKPIKGIEDAGDLADLVSWFYDEYPADVADAILFKNVERVVRKALRR